ncbi:patatin-like phospholipase family protein, partial [Lutibacter sp.]|uniref:patatin-like phospholipase family protein n=1 Tax=Lutibacter sp. TaxID=1925666 RepID=UPI00349FD2F0
MKRTLIFVFFLTFLVSFSQEKPANQDLKVGLVLSGGGAKGLAHVSVLKVLEEAGVRVDYIGGTSMGAIIGALYASGYTANQLDSILKVIDFDLILTDQMPRKSKPFYEKEIGEKYALSLPVKNKRVGIPRALSEGQSVLNLLTKLTQHVNNITDFNKLPIPFVCIATNLETGKQEILNSGFLPEAVKASGSFPTLLAPVEIDEKILTDGGIVNNFPVDEVISMGADIIIGVDIQSGLDKKDNLSSAVAIINQIVGFQMYKTLDYKYGKVDVLIKPDVTHYNVISFDKKKEIMKAGDEAAREHMDNLRAIAKQQTTKETPKIKTKQLQYDISDIRIQGNLNYTRAYILGKLNLKKQDKTGYNKLIQSINNLYATGNFENVQYKILDDTENEEGSVLSLKVKEHRISNYLQLGAHFDDLYKTGIIINSTAKHLFNKNDIISADIILGDNIRYNFDYFIDNGFYTSFGVKSRYNSFNANLNFEQTNSNIEDSNVNEINLVYEDFTNQIYFQTVFNRKFALGVGGEHKHLKVFTETISSLESTVSANREKRLYFDNSDYLNLIAYLKIDTYDKKYFQKYGVFLDTEFRWFLNS